MEQLELWVQNGTNGIHLKNGSAIAITYGVKKKEHAVAIVSAINNTYGAGINPEAIPLLIKAMKELIDCLDCEGPGWISDAVISQCKTAIEKAKL